MTKRWSSTRKDLSKTKRRASKDARRKGKMIEIFEGQWREVKDPGRSGWWRFHAHYDRDGYCDNPARGY